jgi:hypothetical protein
MRKLLLFVVFLGLPLEGTTAESERVSGFVCIPDYATGYAIGRSNRWEPLQFDVIGKKYLLRNKGGSWFWTTFGEEPHSKIDLCTAFNEQGFMDCKNREDQVLFNRNTLRFQVVRPYGYVVADAAIDKQHRATPFYEIGTCSPL